MNLKRNYKIWLFFCIAILFRLVVFVIADNVLDITDYETHSRLFETRRWISDGWFYPSTYFAPAYYYIIRFCWFFYSADLALLPRIVNLLFGAGIVFIYVPLMRKFFSELVVWSSAVLLVFSPLPVILSVVTISSIPYTFFALLFFYMFMLYFEKKSFIYFLLGLVFANITIAFRFEAVLLLPPFALLLLQKRQIKQLLFFCIFSLVTFLLHLFFCYLATGDMFLPLRIQNYNAYGSVIKLYPTAGMRLLSFFNAFSRIFSHLGMFFITFGSFIGFKYKQGRILLGLFVLSFFVLLVKTLGGTFEAYFLRYYCLWAVILLPFMLLPLEWIFKRYDLLKRFIVIGFVCVMSVFYAVTVVSRAEKEKPMGEYHQVVSWIKANVKKDHVILLDRVHRHYIIVEANLRDRQILDPVCLPNSSSVVDVAATLDLIDIHLPLSILVYRHQGGGYREVDFLNVLKNRRLYRLEVLYENDIWSLVSIGSNKNK